MPPIQYSSIIALEDNNTEIYMGCTEVLVRIARNILKEPSNPKYRSISLGSNVVTSKLLPASGAIQCLFDMGFQEGSDKLVLPPDSSLSCIKYIHDELIRRRELRKCNKSDDSNIEVSVNNPILISLSREVSSYIQTLNNDFFNEFTKKIINIWRCESKRIQLKALKHVPLADLKRNVEMNMRRINLAIKKKEIEDTVLDCQELLLFELCKWFKSSFFKWTNTPECSKCGKKETVFVERRGSIEEGISAIEVYKCSTCCEIVLFPRYNHAEKLLETRCGRCGEWALCFFLICRSLGWDVRYVLDETDHVWVEVYLHLKKKWVHCDPCETLIDAPLVYECGWKKKLSYIIAFSKDEIQDVTWRYSCNYSKILENRKKCSEELLVQVICNIRNILLKFASEKRREFVIRRAALELVDLLEQRSAKDTEKQGRSSGSLVWRLARGETTSLEEFKPFIWKPGKEDKKHMEFKLSYCTTSDKYFLGDTEKTVDGWKNGLYKVDGVFRKEELDWKMAYLARKEGSDKGNLVWRFEMDEGFEIGDIEIKIVTQKYETGRVLCKLYNDSICINIPNDISSFTTSDFKGSKLVDLSVELSGGGGDNAWQHAQLFRQSFSEHEKTFQITIHLIKNE